jgi:chaperone required for assembly of F1-ATPase
VADAAPVKRFWKEVSVEPTNLGWRVALDGRPVKTQAGQPQVVPARALAERLAGEWAAQGEEIDPAGFMFRDIADYAIDQVAPAPEQAIGRILRFGETDTLCYRADPDEPLHRRQWEVWEPLVAEFEKREGVTLERVSGVLHRPQPEATLATLRARLESENAFTLAALETIASLAASLCIALEAIRPEADAEALWEAAELEEHWQAELWGREAEAEARREKRRREFLQAIEFAKLARSEG